MIAFFDSGVGGLSVLQEVQRLLPQVETLYLADTAHVPYGGRTQSEIRQLALQAVETLLKHKPDVIVVACNTATSVAIEDLRAAHPDVPIVGVVPVIKTLAETSKNHRGAVVATPATLSSAGYVKLKVDFAGHIDLLELAMPEWVMMVESGELQSPRVRESIAHTCQQIRAFGADTLVLGSTHFPWLRPVIEEMLPDVTVLDSGQAVARQVERVLTDANKLPSGTGPGYASWLTTGNPMKVGLLASRLLGVPVEFRQV